MTLDFKLQAVEDRKINNHIQILSVTAYLSNVIIFFLQVKDQRVFSLLLCDVGDLNRMNVMAHYFWAHLENLDLQKKTVPSAYSVFSFQQEISHANFPFQNSKLCQNLPEKFITNLLSRGFHCTKQPFSFEFTSYIIFYQIV